MSTDAQTDVVDAERPCAGLQRAIPHHASSSDGNATRATTNDQRICLRLRSL